MKAYLLLLLALANCATQRYTPAVDAKVDSALVVVGIPPLAIRKLKFIGPVTIQLRQGNTNSQVSTDKTAQRAPAVSTGPNSPVMVGRKVPWWVFGFLLLMSIAGWEWLNYLRLLAWLPWRM